MKRKLDTYLDETDVDLVQIGSPAMKKRKIVKVIDGKNVIISGTKKLRIYINKHRNDLEYIQKRLFGNMEFVIGGVHVPPPFMLTKKFMAEYDIDFIVQISKNINDIHMENVYIRETGKLLVLIPRQSNPRPPQQNRYYRSDKILAPPQPPQPPPFFNQRSVISSLDQNIPPPPGVIRMNNNFPTRSGGNSGIGPNMMNFGQSRNQFVGSRKKKKKKKKSSSYSNRGPSDDDEIDDLEEDFDL